MKKIKEQINHIEIIYYKTLHAHKTAKEENLRHLLQLSFHLLDDIWEELDLYLTKEERKHGAKRTGGKKIKKGKKIKRRGLEASLTTFFPFN